ncbi:MAG: SDR family NAD(P)-dependent oxidoreductase, partial [Candidatus Marinimicrobia bacterium]|nr:SDR family NAD(P)-dependent oxidoreductase [Candidatus Neomarinimicrobiota bacterium]
MMLKGKSAIVTGSTSGIGRGIATMLAREGANVMINGFGEAEEIEKFRQELAGLSGAICRYSAADMTRPDEIKTMIDEAADVFGAIDIVINNAGIQFVSPVEEFPVDKWDAIIAINMTSAFHTIRHTLAGMK